MYSQFINLPAGRLGSSVYLVEQDVPGLPVYLHFYLLLVTSWQSLVVRCFCDILRGPHYLQLLW